MFGIFKDKYVYTCPDVIHQREMQLRNIKRATLANLLFIGAFLTWGYVVDKRMDREFEDAMNEIPDPVEE